MLEFIEDGHKYMLDGVELPSVTQICKPLTVDVAENARSWLRDAAARRGSDIHDICADIDTGDEPDLPSQYAGYVMAYLDFRRDYGLTTSWKGIELPVASATIGVAGTIDRLVVIDNKLTLIDIKTGSTIDRALLTAQLCGYLDILLEYDCTYEYAPNIVKSECQLWGLQLKKDGNYRIIKCEYDSIFNLLLQLHHKKEKINEKRKHTD